MQSECLICVTIQNFVEIGANKNNPLGKIYYLIYLTDFFTKFTAFIEDDSGHIHSKFLTIFAMF